MKKNLLERLSANVSSDTQVRRYNLPDMISESYKAYYSTSKGTELQMIAEAHLNDVRNNPTDIERLSEQLSYLKELVRMQESGEIRDIAPEKKPVRLKESDRMNFRSERPSKKDLTEKEEPEIEDELEEADAPELTDDELEELSKHLEEIRKKKGQQSPKQDVEESTKPRRGIKVTSKREAVEEELPEEPEKWINQYSVDLVYTEGMEDVETRIEQVLTDAGFEVVGCMPTDASWSEEEYNSLLGIGESKKVNEAGSADSRQMRKVVRGIAEEVIKAKGDNNSTGKYDKFIKTMMDNWANSGHDRGFIKSAINKSFDKEFGVNESKTYKGLENFSKNSENKAFYKTFKKLHSALKEGTALTRQESIGLYKAANSALTQLSIELEHNPNFLDTYNECTKLLAKDVNSILESTQKGKAPSKMTMKSLAKFSEALLNEEKTYSDEEKKAIYDKWSEKQGDHKPEYGYKGYTDATYATWEKALNEADEDDEEEVEDIEAPETDAEEVESDTDDMEDMPEEEPTEDEDFVGDDEGEIKSEEEEAYDQEYADARREAHEKLASEYEETEDAGVQDKLEQDRVEVAILNGEDPYAEDEEGAEEEAPEEPAGEESDEEIPDEDMPEEESTEDEDITDDELEELKNHLKEMRRAKISK